MFDINKAITLAWVLSHWYSSFVLIISESTICLVYYFVMSFQSVLLWDNMNTQRFVGPLVDFGSMTQKLRSNRLRSRATVLLFHKFDITDSRWWRKWDTLKHCYSLLVILGQYQLFGICVLSLNGRMTPNSAVSHEIICESKIQQLLSIRWNEWVKFQGQLKWLYE